ncbi:MAG TPA: asparagine synthase-related protein, partial [Bryobacteraceae bacterium]|nr:asparagine synthase-related protein [Bryobacteraceae bacterium]
AKKSGFLTPFGQWSRRLLADRIKEVLLDRTHDPYLRLDGVERLLRRHARTGQYSREVFALVVYRLWQNQFVNRA